MDPADEEDLDFDLLDALVEQHQAHRVPQCQLNHHVTDQPSKRSALTECSNHIHKRGSSISNISGGGGIAARSGQQQQQQQRGRQVSLGASWGVRAQLQSGARYEVGNSSVVCGDAEVLREDDDWQQGEDDGWGRPDPGQSPGPNSPSHRDRNGEWNTITNEVMGRFGSPPAGDEGAGVPGTLPEREGEEAELTGAPDTPLVATSCGLSIHPEKAAHWVYPSQVPTREYQVTIVEAALFANTLCCLPTGLGKTMIAAVVMYNFYRWFPQGKIVFVAPTRPLVAQQVTACGEKTGLPELVTQELTGNIKADERAQLWASKRVFYCTPATLNNDVCKGICPMDEIVCLVIDECHRATGNHPIVQAIKQLREASVKFRILGLSATPGSRFDAVQEVLRNLMISRIEFRGEDDPDVRSYSFSRQLDVRVVSSSGNRELEYCRSTVMDVQRTVLRKLIGLRVFWSCAPESVQRYSLIQAQERYRRNPAEGSGNARDVFFTFQQAIFLASTIEQLEKYGHCQAHEHVVSGMSKPALRQLQGDLKFKEFQSRLAALADSAASSPKMEMLERVVLDHFNAGRGEDGSMPGRVIIFTNLRESVQHIVCMLNLHSDAIGAKAFVGQGGGAGGAGMKQSEQKKTLQQFRDGVFNTLVATCIGEEGLDIPAVDLIVCFDGAASPTRNLQRMGRTGRHKEGRVVYILAEGKEEADYNRNQEVTLNLHRQLRCGGGKFDLFARSPRMVPRAFSPKMLRVDLTPMVPVATSTLASHADASRGRGRGRRGRGRGRGRGGRGVKGRGGRGEAETGASRSPIDNCGGGGGPGAVVSDDELHDELHHALPAPRRPITSQNKESVGVLTTASEVPLPRRRRVDRAVDITSSSSSSEGERLDDEEDAEVVVVDDSQPQSPAKGADPPSPFDGLVNEQSMPSHRRSSELGRDGSGEGELPSSTPPLTMGDGQRDGSPSEKPAPPFKPSEHLRTLLWEQNNWVDEGPMVNVVTGAMWCPENIPQCVPTTKEGDVLGGSTIASMTSATFRHETLPELSRVADDAEALLKATSDAPHDSAAVSRAVGPSHGGGLLRRLARLMEPSSCWALSTAISTGLVNAPSTLTVPSLTHCAHPELEPPPAPTIRTVTSDAVELDHDGTRRTSEMAGAINSARPNSHTHVQSDVTHASGGSALLGETEQPQPNLIPTTLRDKEEEAPLRRQLPINSSGKSTTHRLLSSPPRQPSHQPGKMTALRDGEGEGEEEDVPLGRRRPLCTVSFEGPTANGNHVDILAASRQGSPEEGHTGKGDGDAGGEEDVPLRRRLLQNSSAHLKTADDRLPRRLSPSHPPRQKQSAVKSFDGEVEDVPLGCRLACALTDAGPSRTSKPRHDITSRSTGKEGLGMQERLALWKRAGGGCEQQCNDEDECIGASQSDDSDADVPLAERSRQRGGGAVDDTVAVSQDSADEFDGATLRGQRARGLGFSMTQPKRRVDIERDEVVVEKGPNRNVTTTAAITTKNVPMVSSSLAAVQPTSKRDELSNEGRGAVGEEDVALALRRSKLMEVSDGRYAGRREALRDDEGCSGGDEGVVGMTQDDVPLCRRKRTPSMGTRPARDGSGDGDESVVDEVDVCMTQDEVPLCRRQKTSGRHKLSVSGDVDGMGDDNEGVEEVVVMGATQDDMPLLCRKAVPSVNGGDHRDCGVEVVENVNGEEAAMVRLSQDDVPLCHRQTTPLRYDGNGVRETTGFGGGVTVNDGDGVVRGTPDDVPLSHRKTTHVGGGASLGGAGVEGTRGSGAREGADGDEMSPPHRETTRTCSGQTGEMEQERLTQEDVPLSRRKKAKPRWGEKHISGAVGNLDEEEEVAMMAQEDLPLSRRLSTPITVGNRPRAAEVARNDGVVGIATSEKNDLPLFHQNATRPVFDSRAVEITDVEEVVVVSMTRDELPLSRRMSTPPNGAPTSCVEGREKSGVVAVLADTTMARGKFPNNFGPYDLGGGVIGDAFEDVGGAEVSRDHRKPSITPLAVSRSDDNEKVDEDRPLDDDNETAARGFPANCLPISKHDSPTHSVGPRSDGESHRDDIRSKPGDVADRPSTLSRRRSPSPASILEDKICGQLSPMYGSDPVVPETMQLFDDETECAAEVAVASYDPAIPETERVEDDIEWEALLGHGDGKKETKQLELATAVNPTSSGMARHVDGDGVVVQVSVVTSPGIGSTGDAAVIGSRGSVDSPAFESQGGIWDFAQGYHDADGASGWCAGDVVGEGAGLGDDGMIGGGALGNGTPAVGVNEVTTTLASPAVAVVEATPQRKRAVGVIYDDDGFPKPTPKRTRSPEGTGLGSDAACGIRRLASSSSTPRPLRRRNAAILDSGGGSASPSAVVRPIPSQQQILDPDPALSPPSLFGSDLRQQGFGNNVNLDVTPPATAHAPKPRMCLDELNDSPSPDAGVAVPRGGRRARVVLETQESGGGGDDDGVVDLTTAEDDEPRSASVGKKALASSGGGVKPSFRRLKRGRASTGVGGAGGFVVIGESVGGTTRRRAPETGIARRGKRAKIVKRARGRASCFFEEEADASQDASVSVDEDGDGDDDDEGGNLGGFIVDTQTVTPCKAKTAGSQEGGGSARRTPWSNDIHMHRSMLLGSATPKRGGGWYARLMNRWEAGCAPSQTQRPDATPPTSATTDNATHGDACALCGGEEGELLLCDTCPACCHLECVGLRHVPPGEWSCPDCQDATGHEAALPNARHRLPHAASPLGYPSREVEEEGEGGDDEDGDEEDDDEDIPNFEL